MLVTLKVKIRKFYRMWDHPSIEKSRGELQNYVYETIDSYLSFDNPDNDNKLLPGDILVIVLYDKKAGIDEKNTWESYISKLIKYLRKEGLK